MSARRGDRPRGRAARTESLPRRRPASSSSSSPPPGPPSSSSSETAARAAGVAGGPRGGECRRGGSAGDRTRSGDEDPRDSGERPRPPGERERDADAPWARLSASSMRRARASVAPLPPPTAAGCAAAASGAPFHAAMGGEATALAAPFGPSAVTGRGAAASRRDAAGADPTPLLVTGRSDGALDSPPAAPLPAVPLPRRSIAPSSAPLSSPEPTWAPPIHCSLGAGRRSLS